MSTKPPEASDIEKKEYLHKVASCVVDSYVIRKENVESIFNSLLAAEEEEASNRRNQTDDGRFISAGLKYRSQVTGHRTGHRSRPQVTGHRSQVTMKNTCKFVGSSYLVGICLFRPFLT